MGVKTILECDHEGCTKKLELDGPYFSNKEKMKAEGWKNKKSDDGWKMCCPEHS
jgi:hypothetical protein